MFFQNRYIKTLKNGNKETEKMSEFCFKLAIKIHEELRQRLLTLRT